MKPHQYTSKVTWTGNRGAGTMDYRAYGRNFDIDITGKVKILGSSDSAFNGDNERHNPEDLLLSAVSSCHMLWYLHLCATNGIIVLEYEDMAEGTLMENEDGSGHFTTITLHPTVKLAAGNDIALAERLHTEAGKMCFIANSLNFPIQYAPTTTTD